MKDSKILLKGYQTKGKNLRNIIIIIARNIKVMIKKKILKAKERLSWIRNYSKMNIIYIENVSEVDVR